jgi:GNAT superfamily N-acetyltransferase
MTLEQLTERMRGWLAKNWQAVIVLADGEPVGYALYQLLRDEYFPERQMAYVRQFFVARERRGHGIGARAFERIADEYFPVGATLTLEVLSTNPRGMAFWQKVGFVPYSVEMRRTNYAEKPLE